MLGVQSVCCDYGEEVSIVMGSGSAAAKDVPGRRGLGKTKHLESGLLRIRHVVDCQVFKIKKHCGEMHNSASIGTEDSSEAVVRCWLTMAGVGELSGCHSLALGIECCAEWCSG